MRGLLLKLLKLALIAGVLALALTPVVREQLRLRQMAGAVEDYRRAVEAAGPSGLEAMLDQARTVAPENAALVDPYGEQMATEPSEAMLPDLNGMLAVLEIPKLGATLPVWRGNAAQPGARHVAGTGLMVEGTPARCAVTVELIDLSRLTAGDHLRLSALGERVDCEIVQATSVDAASMAWPEGEEDWLALIARDPAAPKDGRIVAIARRTSPQALIARDDTLMATGWSVWLALSGPVAVTGLLLLTLVGGLRRQARRAKVKRMRL